jgi:ribosomal protein L11 methylase PrmA
MDQIQAIPGSFRDPSGRVYEVDGQIFRTVTGRHAAHFEHVESTGLFQQLAQERFLLPVERASKGVLGSVEEDIRYVLQVPKLPFVAFPYEWPFSALKAAALLHLKIHLAALDKGVTLSDASAYNIQFYGGRPVFIDHLSFRKYQDGEMWAGHRQFSEQFLNPLLLRAFFGVSHNAWYRGTQEGISASEFRQLLKWRHYLSWNVLKHVVMQAMFQRAAFDARVKLEKVELPAAPLPLTSFRHMLNGLHSWVSTLEPAETGKTLWQDYATTHSYAADEERLKRQFIDNFVQETRPKLLWDLGCNTGDYAKVALASGAEYVVGFDSDQGALDSCFERASRENLAFQALFMNMANPSPDQGWMERERSGLRGRAFADSVLALALVHHLRITNNIPFGQVLDWILNLAPRGIIEFVPKSDPMVMRLLNLREDIYSDYTLDFFVSHVAGEAEIIKTAVVSKSGRHLLWFQRR